MGRGGGCPTRREIRAGVARDGAQRQGKVGGRTAHRDCCDADGAVATALRADDTVKAIAVASGENVREWKNNVLPAGPNRCTDPGTRVSGRTSSSKHYRYSIHFIRHRERGGKMSFCPCLHLLAAVVGRLVTRRQGRHRRWRRVSLQPPLGSHPPPLL
jgi:hypothetical protein